MWTIRLPGLYFGQEGDGGRLTSGVSGGGGGDAEGRPDRRRARANRRQVRAGGAVTRDRGRSAGHRSLSWRVMLERSSQHVRSYVDSLRVAYIDIQLL